MKVKELKLARIGNSRGIRLPKKLLEKYGIRERVLIESRPDRIVLRPVEADAKLSWKETFAEMAGAGEDWSGWDETTADGLEKL